MVHMQNGAAAASAARTLDDVGTTWPDIRPAPLLVTIPVTDAEVIAELRRLTEGSDREQFAAAALRIGVLSLRMASGHVDAHAIREAGQKLVSDVRELLLARSSELTGQLGTTLGKYFDPDSGMVARRMERLVNEDGDLARLLEQHVGGDSSLMARTLAQHLGEGSPIFKMLSPSDTTGLRAQLTEVLRAALDDQRKTILQQFSLDDEGSALSRLFQGVEDRGQAIEASLRLTNEQIGKHLTLDDQQSPLSRLKRALESVVEDIARKNADFHAEMRSTVASLQARKEEAARSTRHGDSFEDQLGALLLAQAQRVGDVFDPVGTRPGAIRNSKKGDFVTVLAGDSAAPGARIVWEAKESHQYTLARALEEMTEARANRQAQIGVFVFSAKAAPAELEPMQRYGDDIVVVWDAEDPDTDLRIRLACNMARGLVTRQRVATADQRQTLDELDRAVRAVDKQLKYLAEFRKTGELMQSKGDELATRAERMRKDLEKQVACMDEQLAALRADDPGAAAR
jgi:hypothetical protein